MVAIDSLGTKLKAERERRGLPLEHVSASTKIPSTLLEALERDDLSRWPKGLYRRAFFRSYVTALGLSGEPLFAEFARAFPDETSCEAVLSRDADTQAHGVGRTAPVASPLARPAIGHRAWRSVAIALVEVVAVIAIGAILAWAAELHWLGGAGAVALVYYPSLRAASGFWRAATATPGQAVGSYEREPRPVPRVRLALAEAQTRVTERCRPAVVRVAATTRTFTSPIVTRTGQFVKATAPAAGRMSWRVVKQMGATTLWTSRAIARASADVAAKTSRVCAAALHATSLAFWECVRSAAERAELLASRQLNRTRD